MSSRTKRWRTISFRSRTVCDTREQLVCPHDDIAHPHCRYKFQSSVGAFEDKTATLSDADTVWTDVRHMHMREAIDKLMGDFNKFMQDNAGFKG